MLRLQTTCVSAAENVGEREKKRGRWSDADERFNTKRFYYFKTKDKLTGCVAQVPLFYVQP